MPKFTDDLEQHKTSGHYGFSATKIENLENSEYTLVTVVFDESGSTSTFSKELESCVKEIVKACRQSPRADYLMFRFVTFSTTLAEFHGFKMLEQCNPDDYDGCYGVSKTGGSTALYDAAENAIQASQLYAEQLSSNDYNVNSIVFVLTDGDDNESSGTQLSVKTALENCVTSESMESLISVLVGVNVKTQHLAKYLDDFYKNAGFTQYIELENANSNTLAKLADFVSRSISSQSQALGSGGPSQSLTF